MKGQLNVDLVRKIDFWIGIPLCFVATILLKPFSNSKNIAPARMLFIELSEMGSAVLADPAMRWAKSKKGVQLYFLIFERNQPSLHLLGTVPAENIFAIRDSNIFALTWDSVRFFLWTLKNKIDTVVDLELFSRFTALLTGFSGATRRVGFYAFHHEGLYRGSMLTHRVSYNPHIHVAKNFLALAYAAVSEKIEVPFTKKHISDADIQLGRVTFTQAERQEMLAKVRKVASDFDPVRNRIVLVNPNASELLPQRRWLAENFAKLIQMMIDSSPDIFVLITGATFEAPGAEALRSKVSRSRCYSFAGKALIQELPLLYDISAFMVTNDSGPAHFAAVTKMPTFVLYGPETPKLYGSLGKSTPISMELACSPCVAATNHRKTACRDPICMKEMSPEHVYGILEDQLKASNNLDRG